MAPVIREVLVFPLVHPAPEVQGDRLGRQAPGARVAGEQEVVQEAGCSRRGNCSSRDNIRDSSNPGSRYHMYNPRV